MFVFVSGSPRGLSSVSSIEGFGMAFSSQYDSILEMGCFA